MKFQPVQPPRACSLKRYLDTMGELLQKLPVHIREEEEHRWVEVRKATLIYFTLIAMELKTGSRSVVLATDDRSVLGSFAFYQN